jgi:hypothetical protein
MNLPENNESSDKFCPLAEEFNKSAANFANGSGLSFDGLITKFNILWKFKAEGPQDQRRLTQGLFDGGMGVLRKIATPACRDPVENYTSNIQQVFTFLTTPEQMQYLPDNASDQLVDAALNLVRKSEGMTYSGNWNDFAQHKNGLISLAKTVVGYAEKTREPKPAIATFAAGKTIPPARRLTLSSDNG